MTGYRAQLEPALRALTVTSPTTYAWFGARCRSPASPVRRALSEHESRRLLVARIAAELYRSFYVHGRALPRDDEDVPPGAADAPFVAALSAANSGDGGWSSGWRVVGAGTDDRIVEHGGLRVRVGAADLRADGADLAPGSAVRVRRAKESRAVAPGFYVAYGDATHAPRTSAIDVRVYFHLRPPGGVPLVATTTRLLNDAGVAFELKLLDHPAAYGRCDAAVLYLAHGDYERARASLEQIVAACAAQLGELPPAFTKRLARGVGIGEQPRERRTSFGTSRCRLVAEAVVDHARAGGSWRPDRVLDAVAARFAEAGLALDAPYLVAGSRDRYEL